MMKVLTTRATFTCSHPPGRAKASQHEQDFVRIEGANVLVGNDPAGLTVRMCPLVPPNNRPCGKTFRPTSGHAEWIRIQSVRVCLDPTSGATDGVPPGKYTVVAPGQQLVRVEEGGR